MAKRLYIENVSEYEKGLKRERFSDKHLEINVVEQGIVLPARRISNVKADGYEGGVCDKDFNFVAGYRRTIPPRDEAKESKWAAVSSSYVVDRKEIVEIDEDVIYGGALIGHFGHFIMEGWNRLWYVIQNPNLKLKVLFILTRIGYKSWFNDFFKLMGIDSERIVYVEKPMQFRSVTVPEQSQYVSGMFTKEFLLPYQAIKSNVKSNYSGGGYRKIYLTRTKFDESYIARINSGEKGLPGQGHCFNEKYFEDFFAAHGFEVIAPEELSAEEQISLIMNADEIAATLGTLSNLAIFCKSDVKFIALCRTNNPSKSHFQFLANAAAKITDFYVIDVSRNFMYTTHYNGACMLGLTRYWKDFVADYFGEKIDEDAGNFYVDETIDEYVDFWSKIYPYDKNPEKWFDALKNMSHRIVTLEMEISKKHPLLSYQTHVSVNGWEEWKLEDKLSNPLDQKLDIQAIKIKFSQSFHEIYYSVYYNAEEGWSQEVSNSEIAGTVGKSKPIYGMRIRLDEAGAKEFDILYRVHKFDDSWSSWCKNGEVIYSNGIKINAVQIKLVPKSDDAQI